MVPVKDRNDYDLPIVFSVSYGFLKISDEVPLEVSADYLLNQISNTQVIEFADLDLTISANGPRLRFYATLTTKTYLFQVIEGLATRAALTTVLMERMPMMLPQR